MNALTGMLLLPEVESLMMVIMMMMMKVVNNLTGMLLLEVESLMMVIMMMMMMWPCDGVCDLARSRIMETNQ